MADKTALGDRMKMYERREAGRRCMPRLPICVRIDGKTFSTFTRGLARPYDARLSELMVQTTEHLVEKTGAVIGYTQSDEISLVLFTDRPGSQVYLDGRIQKLTSVLASMATATFNARLPSLIPEKADKLALFDCRVWTVPDREEAVNALLWRELDATKNSISMAARAVFSHSQTHKKNGSQLQDMLHEQGINWNDYPSFFKRGTFVQRRSVTRRFTIEERASLPPKHAAHANPELTITRTAIQRLDMPPLRSVINRVAVVFEGAAPEAAGADPA